MSFSSIRPENAVLPDPLDPLSIILNGVTNLSFSLKIAFVVSGIFEKKTLLYSQIGRFIFKLKSRFRFATLTHVLFKFNEASNTYDFNRTLRSKASVFIKTSRSQATTFKKRPCSQVTKFTKTALSQASVFTKTTFSYLVY